MSGHTDTIHRALDTWGAGGSLRVKVEGIYAKQEAENQQQAAILDDLCDWAQHVAASEDDRIHSIVERAEAALSGTPSEDT